MLSSLFLRILEKEQGLNGTIDPASVSVCLGWAHDSAWSFSLVNEGIKMEKPIQRLQKPELIERKTCLFCMQLTGFHSSP